MKINFYSVTINLINNYPAAANRAAPVRTAAVFGFLICLLACIITFGLTVVVGDNLGTTGLTLLTGLTVEDCVTFRIVLNS